VEPKGKAELRFGRFASERSAQQLALAQRVCADLFSLAEVMRHLSRVQFIERSNSRSLHPSTDGPGNPVAVLPFKAP